MPFTTSMLKSALPNYLLSGKHTVDTPTLNQQALLLRKVTGVVEAVATSEAAIHANKTLSAEGKSRDVALLGTSVLPSLVFLERVLHHLKEDRREKRASVFTVKPPVDWGNDPMLNYLRGREVRDRFANLTQQEKDVAFLQAVDTDQQETVWAMLEAPAPMLTADIRIRGLEAHAMQLHPKEFADLKQADTLHENLDSLRNGLALWLRDLGVDQKKVHDSLGGEPPSPPEPNRPEQVAA